jgi:hypothetical protein
MMDLLDTDLLSIRYINIFQTCGLHTSVIKPVLLRMSDRNVSSVSRELQC